MGLINRKKGRTFFVGVFKEWLGWWPKPKRSDTFKNPKDKGIKHSLQTVAWRQPIYGVTFTHILCPESNDELTRSHSQSSWARGEWWCLLFDTVPSLIDWLLSQSLSGDLPFFWLKIGQWGWKISWSDWKLEWEIAWFGAMRPLRLLWISCGVSWKRDWAHV